MIYASVLSKVNSLIKALMESSVIRLLIKRIKLKKKRNLQGGSSIKIKMMNLMKSISLK